jgi:hypothetical protein
MRRVLAPAITVPFPFLLFWGIAFPSQSVGGSNSMESSPVAKPVTTLDNTL